MTCPSCQAENDRDAVACTRCGATLPPTPTDFVVSVDLRPGALFHGRYEILQSVGKGGMGMVYKARDRSLDEVVAIKVLRPDFAQDPKMAERFKSEIRLARKIRHRNVCAIHDYGEDRGLLYISMEFIEGVDLKHVLREKGALPPAEAYDVSIQVAEGLQAVHEAGIIHRDLKTPNIMRDEHSVARLMDFGIAKRQGGETLTATGNIVGTPEYMSPEQAQGLKVDFRSDIYALGIVIYEIFTGRVPFRGETPISTILKHLNEPPPLDGPDAAALPSDLRPVLRRCLEKDAAARYATSGEVAEALRNARSPSRRQQPMPTAVLQAETLPAATPAPRRPARRPAAPEESAATTISAPPRPRRALQPWLLAVPLLAVAAGVVVLRQRAATPVAGAPSPGATLAALIPATTPPTVAAAPPTTPALAAAAAPSTTFALPDTVPTPPHVVRPAAVRPTPPVLAASRTAPVTGAAAAPPTTMAAPPVTAPPAETRGEPGMLQLAVKPWGEVTVDGRVAGTTPLDRIALSPGPHSVRVRHPLYEVWEKQVTIRPGQVEKVVVDFPAQGVRKQ